MNGRLCWLVLLPALWLAGCGSAGVVPEDQFYRLADPAAGKAVPRPVLEQVLVAPFRGPAIYRERAILHADAVAPLRLRRHHYHFWADPPTVLLAQQLARYLEDTGLAGQARVGEGDARYRVRGVLSHFEQIHRPGGVSVRVGMQLTLEDRMTGRTLYSESFEEARDASGGRVYETVEAFSDAVAAIYRRFGERLARLGDGNG